MKSIKQYLLLNRSIQKKINNIDNGFRNLKESIKIYKNGIKFKRKPIMLEYIGRKNNSWRCHNYAFKDDLSFSTAIRLSHKCNEKTMKKNFIMVFMDKYKHPIHFCKIEKPSNNPEEIILVSKWGGLPIFRHTLATHPYKDATDVKIISNREARKVLKELKNNGEYSDCWW